MSSDEVIFFSSHRGNEVEKLSRLTKIELTLAAVYKLQTGSILGINLENWGVAEFHSTTCDTDDRHVTFIFP